MTGKTTLRSVTSVEEVEQFQRLEQLIWQSPAEDAVPVHVAITVIRNGGGMIVAYDDDGPAETGGMVGLTFWFPGLGAPTTDGETRRQGDKERGRPGSFTLHPSQFADFPLATRPSPLLKMCSHMAGVLPDWQECGLGVQLKLAQREAILSQGVTTWVTWTYDPLFRTNAVLNIRRLGALCNTYKQDWYGVMKDGLNAGVPSDRCQVDWWLDSARVKERVEQGRGTRSEARGEGRGAEESRPPDLFVASTVASGAGFRAPADTDLPLDGRPLAVPIPDDIAAIRRSDAGLGMAWRLSMRHCLIDAFAAGYVITDCLPAAGEWHYLLEWCSEDRTSP